MDKNKLVRLLAIVSITILGTIVIALIPFLFAEGIWERVEFFDDIEFFGDIKFLLLFLGVGLITGGVAYAILKLFQGSDHEHRQ
ncbi:hypothetical protein [Schaalia sp. ZJ1691]|uniref:hypothetical protein n=1 Tax=Schaalia sp. ZJ1691 TaxID=2709404 RepID=UPI0013E9EDAB|nr:hypothetical protein [Schaalia sp. ZJ1691]